MSMKSKAFAMQAVQAADQFSSENFAGRMEQVYLAVLEEKKICMQLNSVGMKI